MSTKPSPTPLTYVWLDYGVATHSGPAGMFYRGSEQVPFCVRKDQLGFTEKEFLDEVCRAVNHHERLVKALKAINEYAKQIGADDFRVLCADALKKVGAE